MKTKDFKKMLKENLWNRLVERYDLVPDQPNSPQIQISTTMDDNVMEDADVGEEGDSPTTPPTTTPTPAPPPAATTTPATTQPVTTKAAAQPAVAKETPQVDKPGLGYDDWSAALKTKGHEKPYGIPAHKAYQTRTSPEKVSIKDFVMGKGGSTDYGIYSPKHITDYADYSDKFESANMSAGLENFKKGGSFAIEDLKYTTVEGAKDWRGGITAAVGGDWKAPTGLGTVRAQHWLDIFEADQTKPEGSRYFVPSASAKAITNLKKYISSRTGGPGAKPKVRPPSSSSKVRPPSSSSKVPSAGELAAVFESTMQEGEPDPTAPRKDRDEKIRHAKEKAEKARRCQKNPGASGCPGSKKDKGEKGKKNESLLASVQASLEENIFDDLAEVSLAQGPPLPSPKIQYMRAGIPIEYPHPEAGIARPFRLGAYEEDWGEHMLSPLQPIRGVDWIPDPVLTGLQRAETGEVIPAAAEPYTPYIRTGVTDIDLGPFYGMAPAENLEEQAAWINPEREAVASNVGTDKGKPIVKTVYNPDTDSTEERLVGYQDWDTGEFRPLSDASSVLDWQMDKAGANPNYAPIPESMRSMIGTEYDDIVVGMKEAKKKVKQSTLGPSALHKLVEKTRTNTKAASRK